MKRKWLSWAVAIALGLTLLSVADSDGFRRYSRLREQQRELEQRNAELAAQNSALAREIEALRKDPRAIERAAREELGWVKPGEVLLILEAP